MSTQDDEDLQVLCEKLHRLGWLPSGQILVVENSITLHTYATCPELVIEITSHYPDILRGLGAPAQQVVRPFLQYHRLLADPTIRAILWSRELFNVSTMLVETWMSLFGLSADVFIQHAFTCGLRRLDSEQLTGGEQVCEWCATPRER